VVNVATAAASVELSFRRLVSVAGVKQLRRARAARARARAAYLEHFSQELRNYSRNVDKAGSIANLTQSCPT